MCTPACIIVEIRSTGGLIEEAMKIYDVLDNAVNSGILVKTFCYGYVASAATVVAQAASPGSQSVDKQLVTALLDHEYPRSIRFEQNLNTAVKVYSCIKLSS